MDKEKLLEFGEQAGATHLGFVNVSDIQVLQEWRDACASNTCGKYGTNWMCPPGVGKLDKLEPLIRQYKQGMVVQTVCSLEDSYDFEGMIEANAKHNALFRDIVGKVRETYPNEKMLPLSAGGCSICEKCTYPTEVCRFPDKAIPSLEAWGIGVGSLVENCGLKYINGVNTVSYVGIILFDGIKQSI